jgi:hypothetical protein
MDEEQVGEYDDGADDDEDDDDGVLPSIEERVAARTFTTVGKLLYYSLISFLIN